MSSPTDEELRTEIERLVKQHLDRAKGDINQAHASLKALINSRPGLQERYREIVMRTFWQAQLDEIEAEDARKAGKLN